MFEEHAATRLIDRVDNDIDFQDALEKWQETLLSALQDAVAA
jgi:hypothetical protein